MPSKQNLPAAISEAVQARIDELEVEAEKKRQEQALQKWLVVFRFSEEVKDSETNQPKIRYAFGWTFIQKLKEAPQRCTDKISPEKIKAGAKVVSIWACDWTNTEPDCEPFLFFGNEDPSDRVARSLLFNYRKEALKEKEGMTHATKQKTQPSNNKARKSKPHIRYSPPTTSAPTKAEVPTYYGPYSLIEAPKAK